MTNSINSKDISSRAALNVSGRRGGDGQAGSGRGKVDELLRPDRFMKAGDEPNLNIKISSYPQDPYVGQAEITEFPKDWINQKLGGPRMKIIDTWKPQASPDGDGNYLYPGGAIEFDQVSALSTCSRTLEMYEKYMGRPIPFAFIEKLRIFPHKDKGMNAYYQRRSASVNFFYFDSPALGKTVQTSESADIVSHETGHSILDGLRPGYADWGAETTATHEAFGDITAFLYALQNPSNIKLALEQNGGDFKKESLLTRLGEEFGAAAHLDDSDPSNDGKIYLRSMLNGFRYQELDTLPYHGDYSILTREPHNFSRVLSGAFYDLTGRIFESGKASGLDDVAALCSARDISGKLLMKMIDISSEERCEYKDFALGMLKADEMLYSGRHRSELAGTFMERNILSQSDLDRLDRDMKTCRQICLDGKDGLPTFDAESFLGENARKLGISDDIPFHVSQIHKNVDGSQTVDMTCREEIRLKGAAFGRYEGCSADVSGGLTLDFDRDGRLAAFTFDPITGDKKAGIRSDILQAIRDGAIIDDDEAAPGSRDFIVYQGKVDTTSNGGRKLVKLAQFVD